MGQQQFHDCAPICQEVTLSYSDFQVSVLLRGNIYRNIKINTTAVLSAALALAADGRVQVFICRHRGKKLTPTKPPGFPAGSGNTYPEEASTPLASFVSVPRPGLAGAGEACSSPGISKYIHGSLFKYLIHLSVRGGYHGLSPGSLIWYGEMVSEESGSCLRPRRIFASKFPGHPSPRK